MKLLIAPLTFPLWRVPAAPANRFRDICVPVLQGELDLLHRLLSYGIVAQLRNVYQSSFNACDLIRIQSALPRSGGNMVCTRDEWHQLTAYVSHLVRESVRPGAEPIPGLKQADLKDELLPLLYRLKLGATRITVHLWN